MHAKDHFCFCFITVTFLLLLSHWSTAKAVTADELANICQAMESDISDISLEYEWNDIVAPSFDKVVEQGMDPERVFLQKEGRRKFKLSAGRSQTDDPNIAYFDRILLEDAETLLTVDGNSFESKIKSCLNSGTAKYLQIGGWPRDVCQGGISETKRYFLPSLNLTPFGFSVLRCRFSKVCDYKPLSVLLRQFGRVDNKIQKVNEFNTIRADLLSESKARVWMHIFFSVDHAYTPVRYEHVRGNNVVGLVVQITSLEKVAEGLWFPSSGIVGPAGDPNDADVYIATSRIVVNQGLTDKDFDIKFPAGTKVYDEIRDLKYIVQP